MTENPIVSCATCSVETTRALAIDLWAIIDGKLMCLSCQEKFKKGWFQPKSE